MKIGVILSAAKDLHLRVLKCRPFATLRATTILLAMPAVSSAQKLYITNQGGASITVVDQQKLDPFTRLFERNRRRSRVF